MHKVLNKKEITCQNNQIGNKYYFFNIIKILEILTMKVYKEILNFKL